MSNSETLAPQCSKRLASCQWTLSVARVLLTLAVILVVPLLDTVGAVEADPQDPARAEGEVTVAVSMDSSAADLAPLLFNRGGMFDLYASNRAQGIPNAISADFMALAYSQLRQKRLMHLESNTLIPAFRQLLSALASAQDSPAPSLPPNANSRAFVQLLQALVSGNSDKLSGNVLSEYQLVLDARGRTASPLWGWMVDYSQFKIRGSYTEDTELVSYYRSFRYASQLLFVVVPSPGMGLDAEQAQRNAVQAMQMSQLLHTDEVAPLYAELLNAISGQFGVGEDLRVEDVLAALKDKPVASYSELLRRYALDNGRVPTVFSAAVKGTADGDKIAEALIGWRLLPAAAPVDAAAFQQLVYQGGETLTLHCAPCSRPPKTAGTVSGEQVKAYPSYRELLQLLGSSTAKRSLLQTKDHAYRAYDAALDKAGAALERAKGLEQQQLSVMQHWVVSTAGDAAKWQHMADSGAAGFWLWQKYLGRLYQKQSRTALAKSVNLAGNAARPGAQIWPYSEPFNELATLAELQAELDPNGPWLSYSALARACAELAVRANSLSADEQYFLNRLDLKLSSLGAGGDAPVVVDLHTHAAEGKVLSVGLGQPLQWFSHEARGARFNLYEFKVPMSKRLTDQLWRQVLQQAAFSNRSNRGRKP